jgi:hypothetical protein
MVRQAALTVLAVLLVVWAPALTRIAAAADKPAADGADFIGKWEKPEPENGLLDVITIAKNGDDWSISGVYYKDGNEVGGFTGKEVKYLSGVNRGELTYVSHIDKAPPGKSGLNDVRITLALKDGNIIEHWRIGRLRGSHTWTPAK